MRRSISESKHIKYLENVRHIMSQLSEEEKALLVGQLDKLDSIYRQFYQLLRKARNLAQEYDVQQTRLTKSVRRFAVVSGQKETSSV